MGRTKAAAITILLSLFLLASCDGQGMGDGRPSICVASWNVQNLFDDVLEGDEYEGYGPGSGWSSEDYGRRLSNVRKVLHYLPESRDYIIVLNEIECSKVAEDIINSADIADMGLCYYACTDQIDNAIQIAVLSSLPICGACVHNVGEGLRPVLEVEVETEGERLFILAVHFKSNVGGVDATASDRLKAARVVSEVSALIQAENPGCLVLVCGDMNEEGWDDRCMGRTRSGPSPLKVAGDFSQGFWYCFWLDGSKVFWPNGSYLYGNDWHSYDNILVSSSGGDGAGLDLEDCGVVFQGILRTADSKPFAWNRNLLTGVSDHLPVWVTLSSLSPNGGQ